MEKRKGYKKIADVTPEEIVTGFNHKDYFVILTKTSVYAYGDDKALKKLPKFEMEKFN